ncbi:aspartic peptidase domain-containing protein, partial [Colletotrichum godetiae]
DIPSNSFSMHIGSVWLQIGGSLIFGGYDQNRLAGEVLASDGDYTDNPITLRDISIEVIQGDGLLAAGNNSIQNGLLVSIDGCAPYITLPKSTCDNIVSHLPVTYDTHLGLYLWDTESAAYTRIVSSASTLSFTFLSGTNTEPLTIRVPFLHLNLTLSEPLTEKPTPYFPCFNSGSGRYALGRAFLQDAFLGANWGQSKWWLGQAPGPNIQLSSSVVAIEEADTVIKTGENDWEESWKGVWKVLGPDNDSGTSPTESPADNRQPTSAPATTISTGAIAGIAIGGAAVLVTFGLGIFSWRRRSRKRGRESTKEREPPQHKHDGSQYDSRPPPQTEPVEVYGSIPTYKGRNKNGKQLNSLEDPRADRVELP